MTGIDRMTTMTRLPGSYHFFNKKFKDYSRPFKDTFPIFKNSNHRSTCLF